MVDLLPVVTDVLLFFSREFFKQGSCLPSLSEVKFACCYWVPAEIVWWVKREVE